MVAGKSIGPHVTGGLLVASDGNDERHGPEANPKVLLPSLLMQEPEPAARLAACTFKRYVSISTSVKDRRSLARTGPEALKLLLLPPILETQIHRTQRARCELVVQSNPYSSSRSQVVA